jgi:hypothetical protein
MTSIVSTPVKRSWAQIAGGDSQDAQSSQKTTKPAARGSLLRFCRGKVLAMLNQYGWLMLYGEVDHPSVQKHGGDVYIHKADVVGGETLCLGDIVTFYLYVDDKGLGAEECRVEQQRATSCFNPNAAEFVPTITKPACEGKGSSMSTSAEEFVPECALSKPAIAKPVNVEEVADLFLRLSQVFASDDEESDDEGLDFGKSWLGKRAPSCNSSTSGGGTSDSEEETSSETSSDSQEETTSTKNSIHPVFTLPPNFYSPPGLSLPTEYEVAWAF